MTKPKTDIDPRAIAADFFRKLGGMDGMTKWGKTHRSLAYQLIAKLLAQPLVQNSVTVNVKDDGEARAKLEDAFMRVIDARAISRHDPAVYVDDVRLVDGQLQQIEHQPAEPRPANVVDVDTSPDPRPAPVVAPPQPPTVVAPPQPIFNEPSTTARYLEWAAGRRDPWRNYG
jgi:hypothetical protein